MAAGLSLGALVVAVVLAAVEAETVVVLDHQLVVHNPVQLAGLSTKGPLALALLVWGSLAAAAASLLLAAAVVVVVVAATHLAG